MSENSKSIQKCEWTWIYWSSDGSWSISQMYRTKDPSINSRCIKSVKCLGERLSQIVQHWFDICEGLIMTNIWNIFLRYVHILYDISFGMLCDPGNGICDDLCSKVGERSSHCTQCKGNFVTLQTRLFIEVIK